MAQNSFIFPRLPRGFADAQHADIQLIQKITRKIEEIYQLYGFMSLETPFIEYTEILGKFLPDLDRPNQGVFSFQDDDEAWLSLRYDLTAPLARHVAEHYDSLPKPYRTYRQGWVFRNEKPGPGRFRQFLQFDADSVGAPSLAADAELCMMAADTFAALGLKKDQYVLHVNNRKLLDGLLECAGIVQEKNPEQKLIVLRAIDKLDRIGLGGVADLLGEGRRDVSGDVTKGAELQKVQIDLILSFLEAKGQTSEETFRNISPLLDNSEIGQSGLAEIQHIIQLVRQGGYGEESIQITPAVVRGLEYYTGPIFEAELLCATLSEHETPIRFGSIGGGGRYDGLIGRFRPQSLPATGFSIGISRLISALRWAKSPLISQEAVESPKPVLVLVMDKEELPRYQDFVMQLRRAEICAELYVGSGSLQTQLKYADKRKLSCAVLQGTQERQHPEGPHILLRDLILGAQLAQKDLDRSKHLELRQKAQILLPERELIPGVQSILHRYKPRHLQV